MTVADLIRAVSEDAIPIRVEAFDGSVVKDGDERGNDTGLTLKLHNERGLRFLLTAPGDLGLARAYVSGDLELVGAHPGDPYPALRAMSTWRFRRPPLAQLPGLLAQVGLPKLIPPAPPPQEALPRWRRTMQGWRHSRNRDARAISSH